MHIKVDEFFSSRPLPNRKDVNKVLVSETTYNLKQNNNKKPNKEKKSDKKTQAIFFPFSIPNFTFFFPLCGSRMEPGHYSLSSPDSPFTALFKSMPISRAQGTGLSR